MLDSQVWLESPFPLLFQLTLVVAWLGLVVLLAEGANRATAGGAELVRKIVHIGAGNVILLAWWLQMPGWVGIGAAVVTGAIALLSYRFPILVSINSVGRKSLGTFFYAVSVGVLIAWFWPTGRYHYAALGILIMAWGDGLAALIGQQWGRHPYKIWGMQKSWEGSLVMAGTSYVISSSLLYGVQGGIWQTWVVALGVAIAATGLEAFSKWGVDNLSVPVGSAAIALVLNQWLLS